MKNQTLPRPFKISIALIICFTVFLFSFLGISVQNMSESTIEDAGTADMAGMNEQVSLHFETIIDLRLTMAESIAHMAPCEESSVYGTIKHLTATMNMGQDDSIILKMANRAATRIAPAALTVGIW